MRFGRTLAIIALSLAALPAIAFENERLGFRGITWGAAPEALGPDATHGDDLVAGQEMYARPSDQLTIGAAQLKAIRYGFYKGRFASANILVEPHNVSEIRDALFAQFGRGYQSNRYIESYLWTGKDVNISLQCNSITTACGVLIMSSTLMAQKRADELETAKRAGRDF